MSHPLDLGMQIAWRGKPSLARLDLATRSFVQHVAPRMAARIKTRTLRGIAADGRRMSPLASDRYRERKIRRGQAPIRDGMLTGTMWASMRATMAKDKLTLGFAGSRKSKGGFMIRNQRIADLLAGANPEFGEEARARYKSGEARRESHGELGNAFMAADASDREFMMRAFDRLCVQRAIAMLPDDSHIVRF